MLAVRTQGAGPRLVALHGFTSTGQQFEPLAALVGWRIDAPDLPGHGSSYRESCTFEETVDAVAAMLGEPVPLLGYSQGARIALGVALESPQLISKLVLISGTPGIEDMHERSERARADRALARRIRAIGSDAFLTEWTSAGITSTQHLPVDVRTTDLEIRSHDAAGLAAALTGYGQGAQPSNWGRLGELTMPVLIIAGEDDTKYTAIATRVAEAIPDATLAVVPDAGHNPLLDRLDSVAELVRDFLD